MTRIPGYLIISIIFIIITHTSSAKKFRYYRPFRVNVDSSEEDHSRIWALLVAGSNGWYNYRHQSDVCHAYHVLRNHGIPKQQIITMMYDDIANNRMNPYPGKIYNNPGGVDVYEGVPIDYSGKDVTPENFLAILQGNRTAVRGGNGRIIESDGNDHIFIYFSDHGGVGLISFPDKILTVKDLNDALKRMSKRKQYNQLVFYMEACESGSMFNKVLPKDINVYAITAANEKESSWGCFCENTMGLPCLGDLFSVNWMNDSDEEDLEEETLETQYEIVKKETNRSHVMHYGDLSISDEYVGEFQGWQKGHKKIIYGDRIEHPSASAWPSRDIPLLMIQKELYEEDGVDDRERLEHNLKKMKLKRKYLDDFMVNLVETIIHDPINRHRILRNHPRAVTNLQCHNDLTKAFHNECFHFGRNPYALKYAYVLANLCEERIDTEILIQKLLDLCVDIDIVGVM